MIDDLKRYPDYKNSGLLWLGEVPEHWEIQRGRNLFKCIDIRSSTGKEELLTVSSKHGIVPRRSAAVTMFKAESYIGYKLCWPRDLVINSLWAWARGLGVSQYHGIISSAYGVYRLLPKFEDYSGYIHELVRSNPFQWELQVRSKGIWTSRLQLTDEAFLDAPFPVPSHEEIIAIVRFLDHMDRCIRRYIRAKQKLIKLLEEYKQALIHHAVTRGLDPDISLKPSNVAWINQIPEHWSTSRLGRLTSKIGDGLHGTPQYVEESPYHFINGNNLLSGKVQITHSTNCVSEDEYEKYKISLDNTTLLLSINGTIGNVAYYGDEPIILGKSVAYINCCNKISRQYLFFLLLSPEMGNLFLQEATGTTILNFSLESLRHLPILLPPLAEQDEIVSFLKHETFQFSKLILKAKDEMKLLREYRTRLISDVVTGKLDVRGIELPADEDAEVPTELSELLDDDITSDDCEIPEEIPAEAD